MLHTPDLTLAPEKRWQRLHGSDDIGKLITGVQFRDGIELKTNQQQNVA